MIKKRACPVRTFHPNFKRDRMLHFCFLSLRKQCSKAQAKEYEYNKGGVELCKREDMGVKEIRTES